MADSTVEEDGGGDFTTVNAALQDAGTVAGDTISTQLEWDDDDTANWSVDDDNITVQAVAGNASYHGGVYDEAARHYRLVTVVGHCITVNNAGFTLDGIAVVQAGVGVSDEIVRCAQGSATYLFKRYIFQTTSDTSDQDGIFSNVDASIVTAENGIMYRFGRAAIHEQAGNGTTQTWNINSCSITDCTTFGVETDGGGISMRNATTTTVACNIFNTFVQNGNVGGGSADYHESGGTGTITWGISGSIDSDNSIATVDGGGVDNLPNRTIRTSTAGGDEVLVRNLTDGTQDLRLVDDAANNDAQDSDNATSGEGMILPIFGIQDNVRNRATGKVDIGADAFSAVPDVITLPTYGQIIMRPTGPEYGLPLSETGDAFPQYGQIIKVNPKPLYAQEFLKEADDDQYGQRIVRD